MSATRYVMLISSLPALPPTPFAAKQTPLSRLQLERRLADLAPDDARQLALIEDIVHWNRLPMSQSDAAVLAQAEATLATLPEGVLRELLHWRLELRTLLAALRRRQRGLPAPAAGERWGYGRWSDVIRRHWREPTFALERLLPWLPEVARLLAAGDSLALEQALLALTWEQAGRLGAGHYFDFPAVVVYVLKWNIIDRWTRYNGTAAARRFEELLETALASAEGKHQP